MTELHLCDIQTLTDLRAALGRFAGRTQECLHTAEIEINRTLEWLHERVVHWQREMERAQQEATRAEMVLRGCLASGYRDQQGHYHQPNCSRETRALEQALAHLRECQGNLQTAQAWRSQVEHAVNEYRGKARRTHDLASGHTERAQAFLDKTAARYENVRAAASGVGSALTMAAVSALVGNRALMSTANDVVKTFVGREKLARGQWGEHVGESITLNELGLKAVNFEPAKHGFDHILQTPSGQIMVLECKTNSEGKLKLEELAGGYKQGSVAWVEDKARRMTDPSSALWSPDNERIGRQILETGPENVRVLATVLNPNTGLADIYVRRDDAAEEWTLLSDKIPLWEEET